LSVSHGALVGVKSKISKKGYIKITIFLWLVLQCIEQTILQNGQGTEVPNAPIEILFEQAKAADVTDGIQQTNFFPPQRHMFPDNSPGRVMPLPGAFPNKIPSLIPYDDHQSSINPTIDDAHLPLVWGGIGFRGIPTGKKMAANGVEFDPVFTLDIELNIALCKNREVYLFTQSRFWGQGAAAGITNPTQGQFDFSKRQYDLGGGIAWNYWRTMEARFFAYSSSNLNRGNSLVTPYGYNDGVGLSNRFYYLGNNFFGAGYMPTKDLIGNDGIQFQPSWFLESSIWYPIFGPKLQGYWAASLIGQRSGDAKLLYNDIGISAAFLSKFPSLEFRTGGEITTDLVVGKTFDFYYVGLFLPF